MVELSEMPQYLHKVKKGGVMMRVKLAHFNL
jgi:hypothetical protein